MGPSDKLGPTSLSFGDQPAGTSGLAQTVTLTNTGGRLLTVSSVTLGGTHSGDFTLAGESCTAAPLQGEGSCTVSVAFRPTTTGGRSAVLNIVHDDLAGGSPATVSLSGTGITAEVALDPTGLDFGNQAKDTASAPRSVTLTNNGSATLGITKVDVVGANAGDFPIDSDGCGGASVAAGGSCAVSLHFLPTAGGSRSATLVFQAATGVAYTVPVSGIGLAPAVTLTPSSLDFGSLPVGALSPSGQLVEIRNTGNAQLTGLAVSIAGANPADFIQSNFCGSVLIAGGFCTVTVKFQPQDAGTRSALLTVTSDAPGSPHTAALSGIGTTSTTPTSTPAPVETSTPTATGTATATATASPTATGTPTPTETPTSTPASTPTEMPSPTETPTGTPSETPTETPAATPIETATAAPTGTATPTNTPTATSTPPSGICPRTMGFWKNTPSAWSVDSLNLGEQSYSKSELLAILGAPSPNDASVVLARQLIAAQLNLANGSDPTGIVDILVHADYLLQQHGGRLPFNLRVSSPEGRAMVADSDVLERYNTGELTPGCAAPEVSSSGPSQWAQAVLGFLPVIASLLAGLARLT